MMLKEMCEKCVKLIKDVCVFLDVVEKEKWFMIDEEN